MEIKFYRPNLPKWFDVAVDIKETYDAGILYPGRYTLRLEEMMRSHFNTKYAIAVNNCSNALILLTCDLPRGSKIIIPSYTFRATYQVAEWNNLIPVVTDLLKKFKSWFKANRALIKQNLSKFVKNLVSTAKTFIP